MSQDLSFLPFFITEDLFILPEDRPAVASPAPVKQTGSNAQPKAAETAPPAKTPALATPAASQQAAATPATKQSPAQEAAKKVNPHLIFGKNLKQLLILVEDHANPVMERADGLLLKDILKAVDYSFDDVAIVNICHCREEADWETVNAIPYTRLFSFGVVHTKLPATKALAPYKLESSGERKFLLTDKLSVLRSDRSSKIALWNLLKQIFV